MAESIFTERFGNIVKKRVCTTTGELNFDSFTVPGTYEIYEDMGSGQNRVYFLTVDKSASGKCTTQTRTHCGKVEYRHNTSAGVWTDWAEVTGGGGSVDLSGKEDVANKVDDIFSNASNTVAYPSTKAVYDFGYATSLDAANQAKQELIDFQLTPLSNRVKDVEEQVQSKASESYVDGFVSDLESRKSNKETVEWELVRSGEMAEDVQQIEIPLGNNYKELYVRFVIPTMNPDNTSGFSKARIYLYAQNNQTIADQGNTFLEDVGVSSVAVFKIQMIGNYCTSTRMFEKKESNTEKSYELLTNTAGVIGMTSGKKLTENHISQLKATMLPNNTRMFITGSTYEIWGVKA